MVPGPCRARPGPCSLWLAKSTIFPTFYWGHPMVPYTLQATITSRAEARPVHCQSGWTEIKVLKSLYLVSLACFSESIPAEPRCDSMWAFSVRDFSIYWRNGLGICLIEGDVKGRLVQNLVPSIVSKYCLQLMSPSIVSKYWPTSIVSKYCLQLLSPSIVSRFFAHLFQIHIWLAESGAAAAPADAFTIVHWQWTNN